MIVCSNSQGCTNNIATLLIYGEKLLKIPKRKGYGLKIKYVASYTQFLLSARINQTTTYNKPSPVLQQFAFICFYHVYLVNAII